MSVGRICVRDVDLARTGETVQVAAQRMHSRNVGTLVVVDADQTPLGIVTDRDLTVRVLAHKGGADGQTVGEVMTAFPRTVHEDTPIEEALRIMRQGKFRRLPVVDGPGHLRGMVSLDDILELLTEEFAQIRGLLQEESPARLAQA
ncbi:MAG: CBS domain-containing protein [Planctomycetaceae bacterium]|jgi:CBS domain-containing protein